MKKGSIRCNVCRCSMVGPVCKCGNTTCYIALYWNGKHYRFGRDKSGDVFDYREAMKTLIKFNGEIEDKQKKFKPEDWTDASIKQRRFDNVIEEYYREKDCEVRTGELSPEYVRIIKGYYNNYFNFFNEYDVREIERDILNDFRRQKLNSLKIKSRKNVLNALRAFFTWLHENGYVLNMPVFPRIKGNDSETRRAIKPEQQEIALNNIPNQFRDPIEFMMKTGLRPSELCAIIVKSVDISNRVIWVERSLSGKIYRETTKNKSKLPIPLNDRALSIVKRNIVGKFPKDFLFVNPITCKGYTIKYLSGVWNKYSGSDVKFYEATRHSYCTNMVPLTDSLTAQRLMRHRDKRSTDNYYHAYSDVLLDVLQRMDNVVDFGETKKRKRKGNE